MHWRIEENLREVESSLRKAAEHHAELVLFPELTLTGFHTKVPRLLQPSALKAARRRVAAVCADTGLRAAVGLPVWFGGDRPCNAVVVFDADGSELLRSAKLRLMPPGEPLIFEAGTKRPILQHAGSTFAVVICREIVDRAELTAELAGRVRNILWPGSMARPPLDTADQARDLAKEQDAWIYHSNWARNVRAPRLRNTGKSLVISPAGQLVLEAPAQEPGLLLAWQPSLEAAWVAMPAGATP